MQKDKSTQTVWSICIGSTSARLAPILIRSLWSPKRSSFRKFIGRHLQDKSNLLSALPKTENFPFYFCLNDFLSQKTKLSCFSIKKLVRDLPVCWSVSTLTPPSLKFLIIGWRRGSWVTAVDGMSPSEKRKKHSKFTKKTNKQIINISGEWISRSKQHHTCHKSKHTQICLIHFRAFLGFPLMMRFIKLYLTHQVQFSQNCSQRSK